MASEVFNLAILLTLKDSASGGLDRFSAKLRTAEKDGEHFNKTFDDLRENLNRDLAIGGVGIAGLGLLWKGIKTAGQFQSSMTDLRATLAKTNASGSVDLQALADDMAKAEKIAIELGNALPGTTEDFVTMMGALKQNGLEATTIINGAADAVAKLAVANNAVPKEVAADFAQFGKLYNLNANEYLKAADVFSRIYTSTGQTSGDLVEAAKYFQGRMGGTIGMGGLQDAQQMTRIFGLLGMSGLRGTQAGTAMNNLFSGYYSAMNRKDNPIERLKQLEGIDLKLFDDKGKFAGIDNLFKQLEPLRKLSDQKRGSYLKEIFGEEGMSAATIFLKEGAEGWKRYNAEQDKTISQADKVAMKSKDFDNQLESLLGTMKNLAVTTFLPVLPDITSGIKSLNDLVGGIQQIAKENPNLAKTLVTFAGYGSTALVVYSAFKTLTTGVRMFRLASAFSRGDGLVQYLNATQTAATGATTSIANTTKQAKGLRGALQSQTFKIGVQIAAVMGIEYLISVIQSAIAEAGKAGAKQTEVADLAKKNVELRNKVEKEGTVFNKQEFQGAASTAWFVALNQGLGIATKGKEWDRMPWWQKSSTVASQSFLYPITKWQGAENKFTNWGWERDKNTFARGFKQFTPELADTRVMTEFLRQLDTRIPNKQDQQMVREGLSTAFPTAYSQAMDELNNRASTLSQSFSELSNQANAQKQNTESINAFGQTLKDLQQPFSQTNESVLKMGDASNKTVTPLGNVSNSANRASGSLNNLSSKIENWQMPTPQFTYNVPVPQGTSPVVSVPSRAIGGVVERDGLAMVHAGNIITPAGITKGLNNSVGGVNFTYAPELTLNGVNENTAQQFRAMLYEHSKEIERIVAKGFQMGRARS